MKYGSRNQRLLQMEALSLYSYTNGYTMATTEGDDREQE